MKKLCLVSLSILTIIGAGCKQPSASTTVAPIATPPAGRDETRALRLPVDRQSITVPLMPAPNVIDPSPTATPVQTNRTTSTRAVKTFTLTAKQWAFEPTAITVNQGDVVRLDIRSLDVTHGFSLPSFNINQTLTPGQTATIEFTADQTGTFTFFCSVFCGEGHAQMTGTLIVQ